MNPEKILQGKNFLIKFLKAKGFSEEQGYFDQEYSHGVYFRISPRKLLVVYEVFDEESIKQVRNHFLLENGFNYCAILQNSRIIFFRNFGEGRSFLYSYRTRRNKSKLEKLSGIAKNFDALFQKRDVSGHFYEEFKSKRNYLVRHIRNGLEPVKKYLLTQKLFDRIFFIYFLCHKAFIQFKDGKTVSGRILFNTLLENGDFVGNLKELFYRFNVHQTNNILKVGDFEFRIPYLNGILFQVDPLEPDLRFDLTEKDWKEIFNFLNEFHWVIEEDIELAIEDEEKVLTPEILGHVYERSVVEWEKIGFEKEAEDATKPLTERKKKGVYYTPQDITEHVCRNTILPYVLDSCDSAYKDIEDLLASENKGDLENAWKILSAIKVLDPACGSGAFLIQAAQLLFHLKVRILKQLGKKPDYYQIKLQTITENIYGVDILEGALEIAKLRLWLWLISEYREGTEINPLPNIEYNLKVGNSLVGWLDEKLSQSPLETPLATLQRKFHELITCSDNAKRASFERVKELLGTPQLENYIEAYTLLYTAYRMAHGLEAESLKHILEIVHNAIYQSINPAFLAFINEKIIPNYRKKSSRQLPISQSMVKSLMPFHWRVDFGHVFKNGGFAVVIGNPPYGSNLRGKEATYLSKLYSESKGNKNAAVFFIALSNRLIERNGRIGLLIPKSFAFASNWEILRNNLLDRIYEAIDVLEAFKEVKLEQMMVLWSKKQTPSYEVASIDAPDIKYTYDKSLVKQARCLLLYPNADAISLFTKLARTNNYLGQFTKTKMGLNLQKSAKRTRTNFETLSGRHITSFHLKATDQFLPASLVQGNKQKFEWFLQPKIVVQKIIAHITRPHPHIQMMGAYDRKGRITLNTVENTVITSPKIDIDFVLALIHSKLMNWYAYHFIFADAIRSMAYLQYYVNKMPLPKKLSDEISTFSPLLRKCEQLAQLLDSTGHKKYKDALNEVKREIDEKIYSLYGLTQEEKALIESEFNA